MQTIDISELELLTESENPVIVDVREDFEYNSGHVPNAKNIPGGTIAWNGPLEFTDRL